MPTHSPSKESEPPRVFLSHAGQDSDPARELARHLKDAGLDVWLDVEQLRPGDRWMETLEQALEKAMAFVVYVGPSGVRDWVDNEIRVALDKSARDRSFRLIPVLGPGSDPDSLPLFLKQYQWQDFREGFGQAFELKNLIEAVSQTPTRAVSVLPPRKAPFRGLLAFDVDDALLFYGRERETEELLDKLRTDPFLAVVGDSGSGKSSLVRAGLIPALHRGRLHDGASWLAKWRVAIMRPGVDPFGALAEGLPALDPSLSRTDRVEFIATARNQLSQGTDGVRNVVAAMAEQNHTVIVVDQFEELFTLTTNASERSRFIETLLGAARSGEQSLHVVITLRADFYSHCWQHEGLLQRIGNNQYLVRRVRTDQLGAVIEKPLALAGAEAEPGLVDSVLHDAGDDPGNLPLIEHALLQLWERREGNTLTHTAYHDIGRLSGALKNHADQVFGTFKTEREKAAARKILLSLTLLGEGLEDTRRRTKKALLLGVPEDDGTTAVVLGKLVDARLVTVIGGEDSEDHEGDVVEVAHEALIREWPRMRGWIDESRESLRLERWLHEAANEYMKGGRDPALLLRGSRLASAEAWLEEQGAQVAPGVRTLVEESARRRTTELRWTRAFAGVMTATVLVATMFAFFFYRASEAAKDASARVQLSSIDPVSVVDEMARLVTDEGRTADEIVAALAESALRDNRWLAMTAHELEDRWLRDELAWARDVKSALPARVSEARGLDPPPSRDDFATVRLKGHFMMGSELGGGYGYNDELPVHRVTLSPYDLQRYEVSAKEYQRFDSDHEAPNDDVNMPALGLSWYEAMAYAVWVGGSLPTEAQWEFAARGEEGRTYPWPKAQDELQLQKMLERIGYPVPVTSRPEAASPEGIHHLAGNAYEWCRDWYAEDAYENDEDGVHDPLGPENGTARVLRGGSYASGQSSLPGWQRGKSRAESWDVVVGFRVAWIAEDTTTETSGRASGSMPRLRVRTLKNGYGRAAVEGDIATVHYEGWLYYENTQTGRGDKFYSSVDRGKKFSFLLGAGHVIKGWEEGIPGMLIGETRELIIAPELAYGRHGMEGAVPPDTTLLFEVELLELDGPADPD